MSGVQAWQEASKKCQKLWKVVGGLALPLYGRSRSSQGLPLAPVCGSGFRFGAAHP